jgi:dihydrofolate reductase
MRKLIAGMKISVDGKVTPADWAEDWADAYDLTPQIDACVLGGGMYPEYESYWTAVQNEPDKPLWADKPPSPAEIDWGRFAAKTPHYVLSGTLTSAKWPNTKFLRGLDDLNALKQQPGKDLYLVGGASTTARLIDAGAVDEVRLVVYPLIAGEGKALFEGLQRRALALQQVQPREAGRLMLVYAIP